MCSATHKPYTITFARPFFLYEQTAASMEFLSPPKLSLPPPQAWCTGKNTKALFDDKAQGDNLEAMRLIPAPRQSGRRAFSS